jgi:hypothetical protein
MARAAAEHFDGQIGAAIFVVGSAGLVDRVVKQDRERDFDRHAPGRAVGDLDVEAGERGDVIDAMVGAMRLAVAAGELGQQLG